MSGPFRSLVYSSVGLVIALSACAPSGAAQPGAAAGSEAPGVKKTITLAHVLEPADLGGFTGAAGSSGPGAIRHVIHNGLTFQDEADVRHPLLAAELPSAEKGTWRVNPDGSMDVTWKVHQNIQWHDGTPFTTADLAFSFRVHKDPDLPTADASTLRLVESVTTPDASTLLVHWAKTYVNAHAAPGLTPLPRHLLEEVYNTDKALFVSGAHFRDQFVGLGPYRLVKWEPGSHFEATRFNSYYLGRPFFDTVILRFVFDANTMVANILAGAIDVAMPPSVDIDTALELRRRWEGTGNQALVVPNGNRMHFMEVQYRPEHARPRNGLANPLVRRALFQTTDRQALADVVIGGLGPIADSWVSPRNPFRAELEASIPQFPYDPNSGQQLLAQAGWVRGTDGVLVHRETGDRFESEIWARQGAGGQEREPSIIADQWRQVGANMTPFVIPAARESDREYQATLPTIIVSGNLNASSWTSDRLHSEFIASAQNRWSGRNKLGYTNPRADPLLDKLQVTIDTREQIAIHRELLQVTMADLAFYPLYWEVVPVLLAKGVKPSPLGAKDPIAFHQWSKE